MSRLGSAMTWSMGVTILAALIAGIVPGLAGANPPAGRAITAAPGQPDARPRIVRPGAPAAADQRGAVQSNQFNFGPSYPFGYNYRGPSYPFGNQYYRPPSQAVPAVGAPRHGGRRWIPGYWGQQWVPQYYVYDVWVPGYYSDGGWMPGRYEEQTMESGGSYQQVWVDGYWEQQ